MQSTAAPIASHLAGGKVPGDTQRLRVCLISEEYPPETGWGGIGTYAYNLARGLAESGHRVHVIARGWGEDSVHDANGLALHRVAISEPSWRWGTHWFNVRFHETRDVVSWSWRVNQVMRRIAATEGLDVIESPEYHAQGLITALGRWRNRLVVKLHTPAFLCRQINGVAVGGSRWDTMASERLELSLVSRAHVVTSPSQSLAEEVARQWPLMSSAVRVVPNPIDEELFRPDRSAESDNNLVLYVGRLECRKGVETLAEALPIIRNTFPEARARLVGQDHDSGPGGSSMRIHLQQRLKDLGVPGTAMEFAGSAERTTLPVVYRSAAVCVVPSLYENFPYTCLEAMACGCAVVGSAVGGIPEMITDQVNGILIPPRDPESLAAAVTRLLADQSLRHRLGEEARKTICSRFSRRVICAETAQVYQSILDRTSSIRVRGCNDRT